MACLTKSGLCLQGVHFPDNACRHKAGDIPSKLADFLDEARSNKMLMLGSHEKNGLKITV